MFNVINYVLEHHTEFSQSFFRYSALVTDNNNNNNNTV